MIHKFCEECGKPLTPGVRFCEECGAPVPEEPDSNQINSNDSVSIFSKPDWMSKYKFSIENSTRDSGIILTNLELLSKELKSSKEEILNVLSDFVSDRKNCNINYHLLDVSDNQIRKATDFDSHLQLLENITQIKCPIYLFIIGGNNIIPTKIFENEGQTDSDKTVPSDLPYSTLDKESPWKGRKYDFENCMTVGRLPTFSGETLEEFKTYFDNIKNSSNGFTDINAFGLSAEVWENTSNNIYNHITENKVFTSPQIEKNNINKTSYSDTNFLYFNLHGAEDSDACDWYGQEGSSYPEAFSPYNILQINHPYILGVEACYGARYLNYKKEESILLSALTSNCLSFLGSSKIAYGTSSGDGCCADIMIGNFLSNLKKGYSAGRSFALSRKELTSHRNLDDTEIKTLAEFALYGDPSYSCVVSAGKSLNTQKSITKLHIPMPDVSSAVRLEIAKIDKQIADLVNSNVYENHPELEGIQPDIYKNLSDGNYNAVYKKNIGTINHIVKAYFNDCGQIYKEYISK